MVRKLKKGEKLALQIILVAVLLVAGFMTAMLIWLSRDLPSMARLEMIEPSLKTSILAADSTVIREYYKQDRILLNIEDIPLEVQTDLPRHRRQAILRPFRDRLLPDRLCRTEGHKALGDP